MTDSCPQKGILNIQWKILIIDDDEDDFLIARSMLKQAKGRKFDVHWAATYEKGQEELRSNHYNAVLVDYDLGTHSGIELIREANQQAYSAPLILYTGRGNYEVDVEAMEAGATLYLTKGEVNPLLLERVIRYAIERKQIETQLKTSNERLSNELAERQRAEAQLQQTNEALRESERKVKEMADRFQAILENSLDAAYRRNLQTGLYDYVSPVVEQILGFSAEEFVNMDVKEAMDRVHPDDVPVVESSLARSEEFGQAKFEYRFRARDGSYRWIAENFRVTKDARGRLLYRTGTLRDVTEQMQLQEQSRQQKDLLERLVETAPAGIAFLKGPRHVYDLVNDEYRRLARGKGELVNRTVVEVWPEVNEIVIPQLDQVYHTGVSFSIVNAPLTIVRNGIPEVDYFTYTFTPIYQSEGAIEGVMILAIETTDSVRDRLVIEAQSARMEAILQALPVGVWITDADGRIVGKNEQADLIWGGDAPLVEGINQYQTYQAWDLQSGKKLLPDEYPTAIALRTGRAVERTELRIRRFDGGEGFVLVSAVPIKDKDGKLVGAVSINMDITDRVRVQEELRLSEERYRVAAINAPTVYAQCDRELRYRWIHNPHPDFPVENVIGKRDDEIGDKEELRRLVALKQQVLDSGAGLREELVFHHSDGTHIYDMSIEPLRDPEGQIVGVTTAAYDITKRKRVEQALQESEESFRQLADAMPQLVWTARSDGTVDYYNQRHKEYAGIAPAEGESWEWGPVLHPEDLQPTVDVWNRAVQTGEVYQIEHRVRMANGTYSWHLSRGIPAKDAHGNIIRWYGTATNINAQKEIEEKLRHSNQELEQFAFVASHDLQDPLRKIILFGSQLRRQLSDTQDKATIDYLERMQNAAQRMQAMINGLLELSRVNTRGGEIAQVDLNRVFEEVMSDLEIKIKAANGHVILIDDLPTVEADELQMHQLFQNLIANAIKFHKPDVPPIIRVSGKIDHTKQPPAIEIRVEDNGIGFEQQHAERIFQPFQRLHGRSEYEGAGLGLSICHKIVERHHGSIDVFSTPGEGSIFIIHLPAH